MTTPEERPPVELPAWFEQYRDLIAGTGGNGVEDLLERLHTPHLAFTNLPVFTMSTMVQAQVQLLHRLRERNLLVAGTPNPGYVGRQPAALTDEGPTEQMLTDWNIHNDHADDAPRDDV